MERRRARDVDVREAVAAAVRTCALGAPLAADRPGPAAEPLAEGGAFVGTAAGQMAGPAGVGRIEVVADRTRGVARVARPPSAPGAAQYAAERDIRAGQPQPRAERAGAKELEELSA